MPERLTTLSDWDQVWAGSVRPSNAGPSGSAPPRSSRGLNARLRELRRDYADFLEWDVLYQAHLPRGDGLRAIEIGSAPGATSLRLHREFGYVPFGVEYSAPGAALSRDAFRAAGVDPAQVFHADALSEAFLSAHEARYDLVISRGFIEHFTEVPEVVAAHVRLVRPGGRLVVSIPKLTGFPGVLFRVFNPGVIPKHNLEIMNRRAFEALFQRDELATLHCDDFGTFRVHVCGSAHLHGVRAAAMRVLMNTQLGLNAAFRIGLGRHGAESALFSPYLIYIGSRVR